MRTLCIALAAAVLLSVPAAGLAGHPHASKDGDTGNTCGLKGTQAVQFSIGSHLSLARSRARCSPIRDS